MNIYDIAKEAGVSATTVSRVLNGNQKVKEETRNKVLKVIDGQNYVPNMVARNLSIGETQNVAFLVPDIENPFFAKILHGISDRARKYDYNVFMFGTDENPECEHKALDSLKVQMIKGLIIIPVCETDILTATRLKAFGYRGIPVVLVDRDIIGCEFDGVFSEDIEGAYEAVECLVEAGHRKIAIITGPESSRPGHDRLKGYKKSLDKNNIEINPEYIVDGNFKEEESYFAMKQLMELENPPTAVFLSNNMIILGCLRYINETGKKIVEDISLVGFDDIKELSYTNIRLTVVTRPVYEMGCEALELLEKRFHDKKYGLEGNMVIRRNSVKTWLIRRGSENYKSFKEDI